MAMGASYKPKIKKEGIKKMNVKDLNKPTSKVQVFTDEENKVTCQKCLSYLRGD